VSISNGIDPEGLVALADEADRCARQIAARRRSTVDVLRRCTAVEAATVDRRLASVETDLVAQTSQLRWRAAVVARTQLVSVCGLDLFAVHGLHRFAASAVFDLATWRGDYEKWRVDEVLGDLLDMTPRQRAEAFATMSTAEMAALVRTHPEQAGAMDGTPPELRYSANRILIGNEIEHLESIEARLIAYHSPLRHWVIELVGQRLTEYRRWLAENRQILLFDPAGDGRVVEVFGDLTSATRVAVVVPGMGNSVGNFSEGEAGFRLDAADLYAATTRRGIATIAWLGYDSPDSVGAVTRSAAEDGAPALRTFVEGIDPAGDRVITVIAHSYGTVLAGIAAHGGLEVDDLVFVGSPGTTLETADDALLCPGGRVWVGLADADPIRLSISPSEPPPWWVPFPAWAAWLQQDMWQDGPEELWHGTNPAADEFGAARFTTDGSIGHSEYFQHESLQNLARIVEGRYDAVELTR
jgi:hypothetical protein